MANEYVVKNGLIVGEVKYPATDGVAGQVLATDGSGNLTFQNPPAGGGTVEMMKLNYASNGDLSSVTDTTSGISSTTILSPTGGNVEINFTGHANPPTSIMIYGYAHQSNEYLIRVPDGSINTRKIAGGGSSGSPTAFGSFTGPLTLTLREAETGASRSFGQPTHAWIFFQFAD